MGTIFILSALAVIVFFAFKSSRKHLKGEGDCCGGSHESFTRKELNQVLDQRKVTISGIHCENCEKKIKNALNKVSYLACNQIDNQEQAIVQANQIIKDEEIKEVIEKIGYKVVQIEKL